MSNTERFDPAEPKGQDPAVDFGKLTCTSLYKVFAPKGRYGHPLDPQPRARGSGPYHRTGDPLAVVWYPSPEGAEAEFEEAITGECFADLRRLEAVDLPVAILRDRRRVTPLDVTDYVRESATLGAVLMPSSLDPQGYEIVFITFDRVRDYLEDGGSIGRHFSGKSPSLLQRLRAIRRRYLS